MSENPWKSSLVLLVLSSCLVFFLHIFYLSHSFFPSFFLSLSLALQMAGIGGTLAGYKSMLNKMSPFTMKDVYGRWLTYLIEPSPE